MPTAVRPLLVAALLSGTSALAGDSRLVIQREGPPCPGQYATARATPAEAAAELLRVFEGEEPRIRGLRAMVMNGAFGFCTRAERREFESLLADIGARPALAHERKYADLVLMLATEHLVEQLQARLARPDLGAQARRRLEFLRAEAPRWIAHRRTGRWPDRSPQQDAGVR